MSTLAPPLAAAHPSPKAQHALLAALALAFSLGVLALAAPSVAARITDENRNNSITHKGDSTARFATNPPWLIDDGAF